MSETVYIDGSIGGGQVLRTSLSLSVITGRPLQITEIRAQRSKPGLRAQHLECVRAVAQIADCELSGAEIGSQVLEMTPRTVAGGDYHFDIPTAGSACLLLQTVLPPLLSAAERSTVTITGGTHNPLAPPFHYLNLAFFPQLARMGARVSGQLDRFGFAPAGGGRFTVRIEPASWKTVELTERGTYTGGRADAFVSNLPLHIAQRETDLIRRRLSLDENSTSAQTVAAHGPGNVVLVTVDHENVTEVFTGFGRKGVRAEQVARQTVKAARRYLAANVFASEHLADQMLLPFALAGGGTLTTHEVTDHIRSNIAVIEQFLDVHFEIEQTSTHVRIQLP